MLSQRERIALRKQLQDPQECVGAFQYLIERWLEDYPSTRSGVMALADHIERTQRIEMKADTIRRYVEGRIGEPRLSQAMSIARAVLQN